jgi:putative transposase
MMEALRRVVQWMHYPLGVMLVWVRWCAACALSPSTHEEMMAERGVFVDHSTLHCGSIKMLPVPAAALRRRKGPVGSSWRMDATCVKVGGQWTYLYRAVDRAVDFLLRTIRDPASARAFFEPERAIDRHGMPEIAIDKRGANTAAIVSIRADSGLPIEMGQSKSLNHIVEQDPRAVKRVTRPMPGFMTFGCVGILITGIGLMHMIRKGLLGDTKDQNSSAANQFRFYSPAF